MMRMRPQTITGHYRNAISGIGILAQEWEEKPHRLVYELCGEVDFLNKKIKTMKEGYEKIVNLSDIEMKNVDEARRIAKEFLG